MTRVPIPPDVRAERRGIGDSTRATALLAAFVASFALDAKTASAQETVYIGGGNPSVTVDMGVLEQLGQPPTVPGLLLPTVPQPVDVAPLRFPSQPPTFPTTSSGNRPVVLVPPPQTYKPTQPIPTPQIVAPATPMVPPAPPPTPEIAITAPVTIEPTLGMATDDEEAVIVEETVEVTAPVAPPPAPPSPPEPEISAPTVPSAPSAIPAAPTAPALPVVTETPVPAPPAPQTATADPMAGGTDEKGTAILLFDRDAMELSDIAKAIIRDVAEQLNSDDTKRLQLLAYAGAAADDTSKARRLSLSRALAVRSELIALGVRSTRIDVRALGNKADGGPADRVDLILADR